MASYTFFNETFTGADTAAPITTSKVQLIGCDIQCQDYAADVGGRKNQSTNLSVGDSLGYASPVIVSLNQIWFKNHSAGSNTILSVTGWIIDN
jgi:hypothetical protein